MKGGACADVHPQRCYMPKEYTSLSTISLEDLFTSIIIDAHKGIYVAIFDVPCEYLNTNISEENFILLNIEGGCVDIMCEVNPEHKKNMSVGNGEISIYLQLLKYMYECTESALLWYDLLSKALKPHGFAFNPYGRCISNSTINGNQYTIAWYVDDSKVFHIDEEVYTKLIESIVEHFYELTK